MRFRLTKFSQGKLLLATIVNYRFYSFVTVIKISISHLPDSPRFLLFSHNRNDAPIFIRFLQEVLDLLPKGISHLSLISFKKK